jgi:hypothetical protein
MAIFLGPLNIKLGSPTLCVTVALLAPAGLNIAVISAGWC